MLSSASFQITEGVDYLTTLLLQGIGLSFLGCFLVFNILVLLDL